MPFDPKAFERDPVYRARSPLQVLLQDLVAIQGLAPANQKRGRALNALGWWLVAGGIAFVVVLLVVSAQLYEGPERDPNGVLLALGVGLVPVGYFVAWYGPAVVAWGPRLEDRRRALVIVLLERLRKDLVPNMLLDLTLDLARPPQQRKRVHAGPQGRWSREDFVDPWLDFRGRFLDGTHLHLTAVEHLRVRSRVKHGSSGRPKDKTKRDGFTVWRVSLRVKPERYPGLADLEERARSAVRLPPEVALERLRVTGDRLELRAILRTDDWVARVPRAPAPRPPRGLKAGPDASRAVTMMLLSLYQTLNHARAAGRPR